MPDGVGDLVETETVPVTYEVTQVETVHGGGNVRAVANVMLDVGGVEIVLQAVQILVEPGGLMSVRPPMTRCPKSQRWVPAVVLSKELYRALGEELLQVAGTVMTET